MLLRLIRHGDPDYKNDSLTELGVRQAKALAKHIRDLHVDRLLCSPLGRARLTCSYFAKAKGMEPRVLPWLKELNGNYEGDLWAWNQHGCDAFKDAESLGPSDWIRKSPYGKHMKKIAGSFHRAFDEYLKENGLLERDGSLYKLGANYRQGESIAVFCHAGVTLTLLSHLLHIPLPICYSQFGCEPSSVSTLALETKDGKGIFRLLSLNDMSHAKGL